jgi:WD40 repeat protein
VEILQAHHFVEATAVNLVRSEVPAALAAVVQRMIAKDPGQRYQRPAEVAQALAPFLKASGKPPAPGSPSPAGSLTSMKQAVGQDTVDPPPFKKETMSEGSGAIIQPKKTGSNRGPASRKRTKKWGVVLGLCIGGLVLAGLVSLWASGVFRFQTRDGVPVLEKRLEPLAEKALPDDAKPAQAKPQQPVPLTPIQARRAYQNRGGDWRIEGDEVVERELMPDVQLVFGDPTWKDYDFGCEVKKIAGNDLVGLSYRITEKGHGTVSIGAFGNKTDLVGAAHRGTWTELGRRGGGWQADRWYTLRVELRGPRCQFFLDNQMLFDVQDQKNLQGAVGLLAWGTAVRFRNIRVTDPAGNSLLAGLPELPDGPDQWPVATEKAADAQLHNLKGHGAPVTAVTFSRDGRQVLSTSDAETGHWDPKGNYYYFVAPASTIRLWDTDTGKQLACSPILQPVWENHGFLRLALTPTASPFLSFRRRTSKVELWDIAEGKLQTKLRFPESAPGLLDLAFTPDGGKARALGVDASLWEWDVNDKILIRQLPGALKDVSCGALAPDGRLALLARRNQPFAELDLATGKQTDRWKQAVGVVRCLTFAPDSRRALSGGQDGTVRLWDVASGKHLGLLVHLQRPVVCVALSPDGRRALAGGDDWTVRLCDVEDKKELACFTGHTGAVRAVAFSPDGRRAASGSGDYTVRVWRLPATTTAAPAVGGTP